MVEQLQRGDSFSLEELYRRYSKRLFMFVRLSLQTDSPEDIVHDVFMRLIEKAHRFNPKKASFKTWLFSIARYRCIDLLRRKQKVKFLSMENNIDKDGGERGLYLKDVLADSNPRDPESQAKALVVEAVNNCLEELQNSNEKQALVLYYTTGKVYREIAEIFGKSISMVKKHITAAQEKVRICLERKGIEQI